MVDTGNRLAGAERRSPRDLVIYTHTHMCIYRRPLWHTQTPVCTHIWMHVRPLCAHTHTQKFPHVAHSCACTRPPYTHRDTDNHSLPPLHPQHQGADKNCPPSMPTPDPSFALCLALGLLSVSLSFTLCKVGLPSSADLENFPA